MRWFLVLLATSGCRSQSTSPSPAPPSPARAAVAAAPLPTLAPEPLLVEELPWIDPDEPRVGAIAGTVLDTTNEPVIGAVLVATTDSSGSYTAITDDEGTYLIEELPPDDYLITLYYVDQTTEYRTTVGDEPVDVSPTIDITAQVGISFTGCGMSMENTYVVDGIDTTGLTFGE